MTTGTAGLYLRTLSRQLSSVEKASKEETTPVLPPAAKQRRMPWLQVTAISMVVLPCLLVAAYLAGVFTHSALVTDTNHTTAPLRATLTGRDADDEADCSGDCLHCPAGMEWNTSTGRCVLPPGWRCCTARAPLLQGTCSLARHVCYDPSQTPDQARVCRLTPTSTPSPPGRPKQPRQGWGVSPSEKLYCRRGWVWVPKDQKCKRGIRGRSPGIETPAPSTGVQELSLGTSEDKTDTIEIDEVDDCD